MAVVNMLMNLRVLFMAGSILASWTTISFSRRNLLHGIYSFI